MGLDTASKLTSTPYLTKSRYVRGMACERLLWLSCHQPVAYQDPPAGSPAAVGIEVGDMAHALFPAGVLVDEAPWEHAAAVERTAELMRDEHVPAIFEAAYVYDGIRIRVDVMERLSGGAWGMREVKSATKVKASYIDDAAVQAYVLQNCGIDVRSIELVHIDNRYAFDGDAIDWPAYFKRVDIAGQVDVELTQIPDRVRRQKQVLATTSEPDISPGPHCPAGCDYWARCTAPKPDDWIYNLPRLSQTKFDALTAKGIERIREIPDEFELTGNQERVRDVIVQGRPYVSTGLVDALSPLRDRATAYLDFEAMQPAIPHLQGCRPFEQILFQFSLHRDDGNGALDHQSYLAPALGDPRPGLACELVAALSDCEAPIVVYSSFERRAISELATRFPQYREALDAIGARLVDLYPIVRDNLYYEAFDGSFSIKKVASTLSPALSYDQLDGVSDGAQAAIAFQRMATGVVTGDELEALRESLIEYCRLDTLALVEVHRALSRLAAQMDPAN